MGVDHGRDDDQGRAELLELLVRWGDPARWAGLLAEAADFDDLRRLQFRVRAVGDWGLARDASRDAEAARARAAGMLAELDRIDALLREVAPDLLGDRPVGVGRPVELAEAVRRLEGAVRARPQAGGRARSPGRRPDTATVALGRQVSGLRAQGLTWKEVAKAIGRSQAACRNALRQFGQ